MKTSFSLFTLGLAALAGISQLLSLVMEPPAPDITGHRLVPSRSAGAGCPAAAIRVVSSESSLGVKSSTKKKEEGGRSRN